MHFDITHTTTYRYSRPVFLEPHTIRLCPRSGADQRLHHFHIEFWPSPDGVVESIDAEGNAVAEAWFGGMIAALTIRCRARLETLRANPFDYLPRDDQCRLPMQFVQPLAKLLAPYRSRDLSSDTNDSVRDFAKALLGTSGSEVVPFIHQLNQTLYNDCQTIHREEGAPWTALKTLQEMRGSCRDLSVLFIDACRSLGIPARFVSGYQEGDPDQPDRQLHAWVEVYVPGGGWRGYDPAHGLAVADRHIAVAASAVPALAAPITGTFRGTGATAQMEASIDVRISNATTAQQQQQ